ncbi:hypothetical protein SAMN05444483_102308 [Salegentibacter echinorum]|uniref:Addiction module component, TIGR02574 family n=1 Tax=Salegentibacter echinorum TaxID=1073325 RepID=A0A1M5EBE6_SALEC|nr:hypothetical protein [Salegentibacter echinorum]SHF76583.1 hypothetical protein SAMN05444483_102308 [Salegentibacter echinorum]
MNIQTDLDWIHKELETVQDPTLVQAIKNILQYRKSVTSERISVEQYNKEIDASENEIESGNFYTQEEVKQIAAQWGKK